MRPRAPMAAAVLLLLLLAALPSHGQALVCPADLAELSQTFSVGGFRGGTIYASPCAESTSACGRESFACFDDHSGKGPVSLGSRLGATVTRTANELRFESEPGWSCGGGLTYQTTLRVACDLTSPGLRLSPLFFSSTNAFYCVRELFAFSRAACPASYSPSDVELLGVIEVSRHGDRGPLYTLPNDPVTWPEGPAQLTGIGMRQHFELGARLRARFVDAFGLLPPVYNYTLSALRSTGVDRTIASANAQMMGLYPDGVGPADSPLRRTFMPVYSTPPAEDTLLRAFDNCPRFLALEHSRAQTPEWLNMAAANKGFLTEIAAAAQVPVNLEHFWQLYDVLIAEFEHGLPMANGRVSEAQYRRVLNISDWTNRHVFEHDELGRLAGGNLAAAIGTLLSQRAAAGGANADPRFRLFSAHDTTVASLLAVLPVVWDGTLVPYASNVVFELIRSRASNKLLVGILYNGNPLVIDGCAPGPWTGTCELESFVTVAKASAVPDWATACKDVDVSTTPKRRVSVAVAVLAALVLAACVGAIGLALWGYKRGGLFAGGDARPVRALPLDWTPGSESDDEVPLQQLPARE
eukprot:c5341_g1_i1.p1 GENE.c5341_g1_i1~~c5341_g1_i1.p1  ORF type:complete len:581 (+),score=54.48 c5341_g1_i1:40-1782(+)